MLESSRRVDSRLGGGRRRTPLARRPVGRGWGEGGCEDSFVFASKGRGPGFGGALRLGRCRVCTTSVMFFSVLPPANRWSDAPAPYPVVSFQFIRSLCLTSSPPLCAPPPMRDREPHLADFQEEHPLRGDAVLHQRVERDRGVAEREVVRNGGPGEAGPVHRPRPPPGGHPRLLAVPGLRHQGLARPRGGCGGGCGGGRGSCRRRKHGRGLRGGRRRAAADASRGCGGGFNSNSERRLPACSASASQRPYGSCTVVQREPSVATAAAAETDAPTDGTSGTVHRNWWPATGPRTKKRQTGPYVVVIGGGTGGNRCQPAEPESEGVGPGR